MTLILQAYPLMRTTKPDPNLHGQALAEAVQRFMSSGSIDMPVGAKVVGIGPMDGNPNVFALAPPNALCVAHDLLVFQLNSMVVVPDGRSIGETLGIYWAGPNIPIAIVQMLPWPTASTPERVS